MGKLSATGVRQAKGQAKPTKLPDGFEDVKGRETGLLESHMWLLDTPEDSMKYISLHKTKSERATMGGEIVNIRNATDEEVAAHQKLIAHLDRDSMQQVRGRMIIVFRSDPKWNRLWPASAKSHQMDYKGLGYVDKS